MSAAIIRIVPPLVAAALSACATPARTTATAATAASTLASPHVAAPAPVRAALARGDLATMDGGLSVLDALRLRWPHYLEARGAEPVVFVDERAAGPLEVLDHLLLVRVAHVELLTRTEARTRFAGMYPASQEIMGPVLSVTTKRRWRG